MSIYYMTSTRNSEISYWRKCKATTLIGAKREATAEYGAGYLDAVLVIAEGDDDDVIGPEREIASKSNAAGSKWVKLNRGV